MPASLMTILIYAGIVLIALVVIGIILTRLYRRATKDVALIRTGLGGEKVLLNGGIMVIPVLHELMQVRLTTVKLECRGSTRTRSSPSTSCASTSSGCSTSR